MANVFTAWLLKEFFLKLIYTVTLQNNTMRYKMFPKYLCTLDILIPGTFSAFNRTQVAEWIQFENTALYNKHEFKIRH